MSIYKFLDSKENLIKVNLKSYAEATQYANENNVLCLTMDYRDFINTFNSKIEKFKKHSKYKWLKEQAEKAITWNSCCGWESICANDFMHRIISLPTAYIIKWLDGKNQLEWLDDYK